MNDLSRDNPERDEWIESMGYMWMPEDTLWFSATGFHYRPAGWRMIRRLYFGAARRFRELVRSVWKPLDELIVTRSVLTRESQSSLASVLADLLLAGLDVPTEVETTEGGAQ